MRRGTLFFIFVDFVINCSAQHFESSFSRTFSSYTLNAMWITNPKRSKSEFLIGLKFLTPQRRIPVSSAYVMTAYPAKFLERVGVDLEFRKYLRKSGKNEDFSPFYFAGLRESKTSLLSGYSYKMDVKSGNYSLQPFSYPIKVFSIEYSTGIGAKFKLNSKLDFVTKLGISLAYVWQKNGVSGYITEYDYTYNFSFGLRYQIKNNK